MLEALRRAREIPCPVVFLTGFTDHSTDDLLALGAHQVLEKPVATAALMAVVRGFE